jgi:hypothetical protein
MLDTRFRIGHRIPAKEDRIAEVFARRSAIGGKEKARHSWKVQERFAL